MSTNAATADRWNADLEDILGLSPAGRQEPGADRKRPDKPARSRLIYSMVVLLGLATLVVSVAHTNFFASIGDHSPDKAQSARTQPRLDGLEPPRMRAGIDAVPAPTTGRDAGPAVVGLSETYEKLPILGSETVSTRWREARPTSLQGRDQTSRAGNDGNAGGNAVAALTAGVVGRKTAAAPDLASPVLRPSRGTSLPDARLAGAKIRLASDQPSPLRPSGMTDGVPGQPDKTSSDEAGMTLAPALREKTSLEKAGAIDALRMLRRQ